MIQYILKNNSIDNYIIIDPKKPVFGYTPVEESAPTTLKEYDFLSNPNVGSTSSINFNDFTDRFYQPLPLKQIPLNSRVSATEYIGIQEVEMPTFLDNNFTDFKLLNTLVNNFTTIEGGSFEQYVEEFYTIDDTTKLITMFNGLQALRVPANKFQNDEGVDQFGNYYIKVSPKFVEMQVLNIVPRYTATWNNLQGVATPFTYAGSRRTVLTVSNANLFGTPWNFESFTQYNGRLWGSVVEIWDSTKTIKKQTKIMYDCDLNFNIGVTTAQVSISPDIVGYDPYNEVIASGDILRVYPRETYFNPMFIEVTFESSTADIASTLRYLKNDAVRDLKTGIIEIYDDNGVTIDATGNISGTVIQVYQMTQPNDKEIRKNISNGQTPPTASVV